MSALATTYCHEVYSHLKPWYANWMPGQPIEIGAVGLLHGRRFQQLTNLAHFGVDFRVRSDEQPDAIGFSSKRTTKVTLSPAIEEPIPVRARAEIEFSDDWGVFLNAAGGRFDGVENLLTLGETVKALSDQGKWERAHVIVTGVLRSASTTVLVSGSAGSKVVLEAQSPIPQLNLADASLKLGIVGTNTCSLSVVSEQGMTPLIQICGIRPAFLFFGRRFGAYSVTAQQASAAGVYDGRAHGTKISNDDPLFGQLRD